MSSSVPDDAPRPRCCHVKKSSDFNGYGFNLHAEKGKSGQFIGKVDPGSPAERAGLKESDRIIEVNGTNIGNENHQQVVQRIKSVPDETRLLVVDSDTDDYYKSQKIVIRGDMPNVLTKSNVETEEPVAVKAVTVNADTASNRSSQEIPANAPQPRLCHLRIWEGFQGYGFNLHAEKGKPGQFIGSVDPNSPAELAGLKEGDRIVAVNGINISRENHGGVVQNIKSDPTQTRLLVVDEEAEEYYREKEMTVSSSQSNVKVIVCPVIQPKENGAASQVEAEVNHVTDSEKDELVEALEEAIYKSPPDAEDVEHQAEEVAEYSSVNKVQKTEEVVVEQQEEKETAKEEEETAQTPVVLPVVVEPELQKDDKPEAQVSSTTEAEDAAEAISESIREMEKAVEDEPETTQESEEGSKNEYNNNNDDVAQDYDIIANVPQPEQEVEEEEEEPQKRDSSPEPRAPTPEPVRAPTPEPVRAPVRDPSPEPPKQPEQPKAAAVADEPASPPVTVGGITWGSAADARSKMGKKRRDDVKSQNLSAKAKYELLMKM